MKMARIGVWMDREARSRREQYGINVFSAYIEEILGHAGFSYVVMKSADELINHNVDIVIAALPSDQADEQEKLWNYMLEGGTAVSFAGLTAFSARLDCTPLSPFETGYADLDTAWHQEAPLRGFRIKAWRKNSSNAEWPKEIGSVHQQSPDADAAAAALQMFEVGKGRLIRWAVDIPHTVVTLQQGLQPVVGDGIPAPDGTGAVDDWILKADDECAMDWQTDRRYTETGIPYFAYPYADLWQQALAGHLVELAADQGLCLPFLDYWPAGIDQIATISHDSDHNIDASAEVTLEVLREAEVKSTWCMIEPGYSPYLYERIVHEGHELAFHYNALEKDSGNWSEKEFARQLEWLKKATAIHSFKSNKNHYTRFEGWGELFAWCEKYGIASDQTRGPSKKGNIGFLFGTCHPYFPIAWVNEKNRLYDVVELHFLTQDLNHPILADTSVISPFLEGVKKVRGVAHFLFHQVHIYEQPEVRKALKQVVASAKQEGFVFWTSEQINDWYRARRSVRIEGIDKLGIVDVKSPKLIDQAVVWLPLTSEEQSSLNLEADEQTEVKYGRLCKKQLIDLSKAEVTSSVCENRSRL